MRIRPMKSFGMALTPPPDKSITIRAIILGMLAHGRTTVVNPLISGDTLSAINAVCALGADVDIKAGSLVVTGGGPNSAKIDAGNSATVMRLLAGAVAGKNVDVTLIGDRSLSGRNMNALISALREMGAEISGKNGFPPLVVRSRKLHGIDFRPTTPSAQIKSAVLLAGLDAEGETTISEPIRTRTHTEDMLGSFGADIRAENGTIRLMPSKLSAATVDVPGDISSAAYPIALALGRGFCYLKNVGTSRRELIDLLVSIGADIEEENLGDRSNLTVRKSALRPFGIAGEMTAALIDELPLIAVLACFTGGKCEVSDASALRNKECDRIKYTVRNLRDMGAEIIEKPDGFIVMGNGIRGGNATTCGDHRIAMSMAVANALSDSGGTVDDEKCVEVSYPGFWELFL